MKVFTSLAILLCSVAQAFATVYYVDFTAGSDSNTGLSKAFPFKHIPGSTSATGNAAAVTLGGGDTVYMKLGVNHTDSATFNGTGGDVLTYGTDGATDAAGTTFTSAGSTFSTDGVTTASKILIYKQGVFSIASVDSETQLTLSSATIDKSASSLGFCVIDPVTITVDPTWGTGSAQFPSMTLSGKNAVIVDGVSTNGFITHGSTSSGRFIYCNNGSTYRGLVLKNCTGTSWDFAGDNAVTYWRYVDHLVVEGCNFANFGDQDATTGDDGIWVVSGNYSTITKNTVHNGGDDLIQISGANNICIQMNTLTGAYSAGSHADAIGGDTSGSLCNALIKWNTFEDNATTCVIGSYNTTWYGNLIIDTAYDVTGNYGINLKSASSNPTTDGGSHIFDQNVIWYARYGSVLIQDCIAGNTVLFRNNVIYQGAEDGGLREVSITGGSTGVEMYNNYFRNSGFTSASDIIQANGSTWTVAEVNAESWGDSNVFSSSAVGLFTDETRSAPDLHVASTGSPLYHAGYNLSYALDRDLAAWHATTPSIGAYEFGVDSTGPGFVSATVATSGTAITIVFDEAGIIGSGGSGGFTIAIDGGSAEACTYSSGDGTTSIVFTHTQVYNGQVVTVSYTNPGDGIEDATGNDAPNFSVEAVTNNSTALADTPPALGGIKNTSGVFNRNF